MATGDTITAFKSLTQNKSAAGGGSPFIQDLDDDLQLTLAANTTYLFEAFIRSTAANTTGGAPPRFGWQVPGTLTRGVWSGFSCAFDSTDANSEIYVDSALMNADGEGRVFQSGSPLTYVVDGPVVSQNLHKFFGLITTGGSGGTFGLEWSNSLGSGVSQVFVGSWIKMTEV